MIARVVLAVCGVALTIVAAQAAPSSIQPPALASLTFEQHPGAALPLDVSLRDEAGRPVRLGAYFGSRPVVLVFDYLHCPNLCGLVRTDLAQALRNVPLAAGRDYDVVAVSIDPAETSADASAAKTHDATTNAGVAEWHFLTGQESEIRRLADAVGFRFKRDAAIGQFAHPSGIIIAGSDGKISRYLLGIDFKPRDLRLALTDSPNTTIPSPANALLLLCYHYDPQTGRYSLAVDRALQVGGLMTVFALAFPVARMLRRG